MLEHLLKKGETKAAWVLACLYLRGDGVPKDFRKARQLCEIGSTGGDPYAMNALAYMYQHGQGGPREQNKALTLNEHAADLGKDDLYNMGIDSIWGITPDFATAFKYFTLSAKRGNGNAECFVAVSMNGDFGAKRNSSEEAYRLKNAKVLGCSDAEYQLGKIYRDGRGLNRDYLKALAWFRQAASDGNPHALNDLGLMYLDGQGVTANEPKAIELLLRASERGCPMAKYNVAERYRTGIGLPRDVERAKSLYIQAAKLGNEHAKEKLKLLDSVR